MHMGKGRFRRLAMGLALVSVMAMALPAAGAPGFLTDKPLAIELLVPGSAKAIISSGDQLGDFVFEGIPDGVGLAPGSSQNTVDVYVAHEQSRVPFLSQADYIDSSVSKLTLQRSVGGVLDASVPLGPEAGFIRFCSAFMAGPMHGFENYTFFVNEESNDIIGVPDGATYGADPSVAPNRQAGFAVMLDTKTGEYKQIDGMGRYNHENSVVVPGGWNQMAIVSTDDTFSATTSQLYMYTARNSNAVWSDSGAMWAFQVTHKNGVRVDRSDPFNNANDYLDIKPGDEMEGRFIRVPASIAKGDDPTVSPQQALEDWSNANNVFQFIRLEDLDYDQNNPRIVYVADTGATRVIPNEATGRMVRGPSGTVGLADNGRIFGFEFNAQTPTRVDRFWVMADGDAPDSDVYVPFRSPDNLGTSRKSMMVQEDASDAKIWHYDFGSGQWTAVAEVTESASETSGIVDASQWFGGGSWLLTVQQHGTFESSEVVDGVTIKREDGQLVLLRIPGS